MTPADRTMETTARNDAAIPAPPDRDRNFDMRHRRRRRRRVLLMAGIVAIIAALLYYASVNRQEGPSPPPDGPVVPVPVYRR